MSDTPAPAAPPAEKAAGAAQTDAGSATQGYAPSATPAAAQTAIAAASLPRIGQIVAYCLNGGIYPGEWRPAIVVKGVSADCAQLAVLTDFAADGLPCPLWAPAATRGDGPGQWRERDEP